MREVDQPGVDEREAVLEEASGHLAEVFDRVPGGVYLYLDPTHKCATSAWPREVAVARGQA